MKVCVWNYRGVKTDVYFYTVCGNLFIDTYSVTIDFIYCPYCGKKIELGEKLEDIK